MNNTAQDSFVVKTCFENTHPFRQETVGTVAEVEKVVAVHIAKAKEMSSNVIVEVVSFTDGQNIGSIQVWSSENGYPYGENGWQGML